MASLQTATAFREIHSKQHNTSPSLPLRPATILRDILSKQPTTPGEYHARTSHRKTRTGCRVCKIRRIKCDETKPACTRCTSTGRKCEGYPADLTPHPRDSRSPPPTQSPNLADATLPSLSVYRLSAEFAGDDIERRSFHYLRECAAYDISGYFETEFWGRLVLQIGHTEPSVRHALLALGSLCQAHESQDLIDDHYQFHLQFSLQHSNKAIRLAVDYLSTLQPQLDVILTCCLVFAWLEIMRNDFDAGLCHLKSGLKILDDFRQPNKSPALRSQHVDVSLIYLFSRLKTQATVYRKHISEFVPKGHKEIRKPIPASFSSIVQARDSLHTLLDTVFQFVRQLGDPNILESTTSSHPSLDLISLKATCRSCLDKFQDWETSIKNSPASIFQSHNAQQTAAMCLLHMYHTTLTIFLETLFTRSQTIYDQYDSSFSRVISLAQQLINNNSQNMSLTILFDMGVMLPLFYVVMKCRNLALRQKALSLLKLAPCREGMWYRQDVIEYAEWKISTEERGRGQLSEDEALPEEARIWNEHMREVVIDGRPRAVVSFQRRSKDCIKYSEDITDLNIRMAQLI
ncbi:hypothetical protein B0O99DRAFT_555468 [Bisporella sp. PMI_857]|nr:hypothetical protein B0O99DRAFT_555468 [Bisporella sp. PMI_857]